MMPLRARQAYRPRLIAAICAMSACLVGGGIYTFAATSANDQAVTASYPTPMTQAELVTSFSDCMTEKGWDMVNNFDEGSSSPVTPIHETQHDTYAKDTDVCSIEGNRYTLGDFSPEYQHLAYDSLIDSQDCLEKIGVDTHKAPSFDEFKDAGFLWTPFIDVPHRELNQVEDTCPQGFF